MFRKLLLGSVIFLQSMLTAEIREIEQIEELILEADPKTFVFLDIDETLIESPIMLGGKAWRRYVRPDFSVQQPGSPNIASMVGVESAEGDGNLYQVVELEHKAGREKMGQIPQNFCGRVLEEFTSS